MLVGRESASLDVVVVLNIIESSIARALQKLALHPVKYSQEYNVQVS